MPEISRFLGIVIAKHYNDHAPPHFHAKYGAFEITGRIADGVVEGRFPRRALNLVMESYSLHHAELREDSDLARDRRPLRRIDPLGVAAMIPLLESAEYVNGYTIHVRFADGAAADIDLEAEIWGEVFEPLKDPDFFRRFKLDKELNTVTWPSGADLAPEFLYEKATRQANAADRPSAGR